MISTLALIDCRKQFTSLFTVSYYLQEPLHLTNRHCFKYNTLVHKNVIGVEPAKDKNGFVVVMKSKKKVVCMILFALDVFSFVGYDVIFYHQDR